MEAGVASWTECYKKWRVFSAPITIGSPAIKSHVYSNARPLQKPADQPLTNPTVGTQFKSDEPYNG